MSRIRSRGFGGQAVVAVVGAVALVGAGAAALFGSGSPARSISLRDGSAWVQSLASSSLERLDTGSGTVGYRLTTPLAATPLEIVDDGTTTVLRDPASGAIRSIDLSAAKAKLTAPVVLPREARLASGSGRTFVLLAERGDVAAIDPDTLALGETVHLGGPLGSAAVDGAGTLWVAVPSLGIVVPVSGDGGRVAVGERVAAGRAGTGVDVTVSAGAAYGLDRAAGVLLRLLPGRATTVAHVPGQATLAAAQGDPADGGVVLGDPSGAVLRIDTATGGITRFDLPDRSAHHLGPPVQARSRIAVPDLTTGELIVIDPATGTSQVSPVRRGPGEVSVRAADGAVVANDPGSPKAVVVTPDGVSETVDKAGHSPGNDEPAPTPQPAALPTPAPVPHPQPGATPPAAPPGRAALPVAPAAPGAGTPPTTAPLRPPGDPVNVRSAGGAGQVVLSWQTAAAGGAPAQFVITAPDGRTFPAQQAESTKTIPAANGTSITFTIRAENPAGRSRDVPFPAAVPQSQVPGAPSAVQAVPGDRRINLSWTPAPPNGTTVQGYRILARDGSTTDVPGAATAAAALTSLTNGADYAPLTVTALAVTSSGAAVVSPPATLSTPTVPFGKPLAPTFVVATGKNGSLIVQFPPANGNGDPVTQYDVVLSPGGTIHHPPLSAGLIVDTFTGLKNGTPYTVIATATNRAGTGPPSKPVGATPAGVPIVTVVATSSTTSTVAADLSVDGNGSTPDACWYRTPGSGRNYINCAHFSQGAMPADSDIVLFFAAHNAAGDGPELKKVIHTQPYKSYAETTFSNPSPTRTWQTTNASGPGPDIQQNTTVQVTCRIYDPTVTSNKGGWWYLIQSSPWISQYYAPAGDFFNGSKSALWDPAVPVCR